MTAWLSSEEMATARERLPIVYVDAIPVRTDVDVSSMDLCAQQGLAIMKDKSRHLGNGEIYMSPDQNGALTDILTAYWNKNQPVEKVQKDIAAALKN